MNILDLWVPIVVSAVAVFFASSIIWMATPIHKKDWRPLGAAEPAVVDAVRAAGLPPAQYMFPYCEHGSAQMKDPVFMEKWKRGPWGHITVIPSPSMGKTLFLWMVNLLIVSALIAYLATFTIPAGSDKMFVVRVISIPTFLAYGGQVLCDSIWKGRPWSLVCGAVFDAVVYTAITCAAFAMLWPKWPVA